MMITFVGWRLDAGCWMMEAGGWMMEAGGWMMEAGGWRLGDELRGAGLKKQLIFPASNF